MTLHVPDIPEDADNLAAALAYANAGWYVLPVDPNAKGGKHAGSVLGKGWPAKSSCDPKQITAWFAAKDHLIALHCGRSGAVALDVDDPEKATDEVAAAMHATGCPYQSTRPEQPERGHYLFLQPAGRDIGNSGGELRSAWGDVRGRNGIVLVAPAGHRQWRRTGPLPVLPDYVAEKLPDASSADDAATDADVAEFLHAHQDASRPELLTVWRSVWENRMAHGDNRHPAMVAVCVGAMKEARAGYFPAAAAHHMLRELFIEAKTRTPIGGEEQLTPAQAAHEFAGIVAWAVGQAKAADLEQVRARVEQKVPAGVTVVDNITSGGSAATAADPAEVHRGQARIAYRVADRYRDRLLHVAGLGWHTWDGTRYIPDHRGAATRAVLAELRRALADSITDKELRRDVRKCESASGVAGVLALAGALEPLAAAVPDIDADPYLLNVANGTLDLRTLELRPHRPADRITKVCRGAYTPGAESQAWQAFLTRVLPDADVRRFVQRLVGVGLLGSVREHVLSIWTGTGANGKSVMDKAIRFALGDYAAAAEPDLFMHRDGAHPTGEMDLRGVRWVAVSESEKDRRLAEATMKRLTGGDTIRARRMRQDFVEFTPSHTPVLITNHLPRVSGDDPAIWRRIRVVPFDVVIPDAEQDHGLDDRLALEADAILTWAVAGYRDYVDRGLDDPAGVLVATGDYQRNSDAIARFIEECCHTGPAVKSVTSDLFDAWERWRAVEGAESVSRKAFGMGLTNKGYRVDEKSINGKKWRRGIALPTGHAEGAESV